MAPETVAPAVPRTGYATQQDLLRWADSQPARSELPRLIRRLILETADVLEITFPAGEGTSVGSWDGVIRTATSTAFVPEGLSGWEVSVNSKTARKLDEDYGKRIATPDGSPTQECTYLEVVLRRWTKRKDWAVERSKDGRWREVKGYGVDDIETWLEEAPVTHAWISEKLDLGPYGIRTVDAWWSQWSSATNPVLPAELLLAGRTAEVNSLRARLTGAAQVTTINAASHDEVLAFIAAFLVLEDVAGQGTMLARAAIIDDVTTWRSLRLRPSPLILVANSDAVVAESGGQSPHHVIVPVPGAASADIELSPIDAAAASEFLKAALGDKREKDADELARLSRISLLAARRRIAVKPELLQPPWAARPIPRVTRRLMLGSRWTESEADRDVIATLADESYEQLVDEIARLSAGEDPFVTRIGQTVAVVSPYDACLLIKGDLQADDLDRFRAAVLEVLGATDPALELAPNERWMASLRGKARPHSHDLRAGFAMSLAILGAVGDKAVAGTTRTGSAWTVDICWELLDQATKDSSGRAWASLNDVLPLIAEAAPAVFLDAVAKSLSGTSPLLLALFGADDDGPFSHPTHTGLLWALELCAWSTDYFSKAVNVLARLAEIDPGGRYSNRPIESLQRIFLPWFPQNSVDSGRRLGVIDGLRRRHPDIAWTLMLSGLPELMATSHPTYAPRFRTWKPADPTVTTRDYWEVVDALTDRLAEDAGHDPGRWKVLSAKLDNLPPNLRGRWLSRLETMAKEGALPEADRGVLWESLRALVARHREFEDAKWRLPDAEIDAIAEVAESFRPSSPLIQNRWLFAEHMPSLDGVRRLGNHAEYEQALRELRAKAIAEVAGEGWDTIVSLARESKVPFTVGIAIADAELNEYVDGLMTLIDSDNRAEYEFARAYFIARNEKEPDFILGLVGKANLRPRLHARLLLCLLDASEGWQAADSAGAEVAAEFWRGFSFLPHPTPEDLAIAATRMSHAGRSGAALDLLALWLPEGEHADLVAAILDALDQFLAQGPKGQVLPAPYDFERLFAYLDRAPAVPLGRLALLEWSYLSALEHTSRRLRLFEELARDPDLFVDLIARIYRPGDDGAEEGTSGDAAPDEAAAQIARNGWDLLRQWNVLPGTRRDGAIDEAQLKTWVAHVRERLRELKRSVVGDLHIGQLLARSPTDPDGRWPHTTVRDLIENLHSDNVERGFRNEVISKRGVTSRGLEDGGRQESELAERYRRQADELQDTWPTVAGVLRSVADSYDADARRNEADAERFRKGLEG